MGDNDRLVKMEIDYSSVVDQKLMECDEIMKVNKIVQINFILFKQRIQFRTKVNLAKFSIVYYHLKSKPELYEV